MELIIAGDFSLQGRMKGCGDAGRIEESLKPVQDIVRSADYAIVNFEGAATSSRKGILKDGPSLKNDPASLKALRKIGFRIVTLANNHVGDFSFDGVMDTIRNSEEEGLLHVGAGENLDAAEAPLFLHGDRTVAILSVCESEALIATKSTPGLAPIDLIGLTRRIRALRSHADFVLLITHGGCEHYQLPTPQMKRRFHFLSEAGADVIINHHQHCFSGYELHLGRPVFYGLGNFLFDRPEADNRWKEGYLVRLKLTDTVSFELIPYTQCNGDLSVRPLEPDAFSARLEELNRIIVDDCLLEKEFDRLVRTKHPLSPFLPYSNHYLTEMYNRGLLPSMLPRKKLAKLLSRVRCEVHREILLRKFSPDFKK